MKLLADMPVLAFLIVATALEVSGDALIRKSLFEHAGLARLALFLVGAVLLAGYGTFLNLAPLEFGQVVGLYIATLFVMWQIINFLFFRSLPTIPILTGGLLIVAGGLIVSFWKSA
jgi:small multidrug resistance family-3 protein